MRIGVLAPPWLPVPPPAYGGTEAVVDRLARGFVAAGHDVLLWTTGDSTCPVPRGHVLPTAASDAIGIAAIELQHVINGYEAFSRWGADIVHDHTLSGPFIGRTGVVPVATTNHGPFHQLSDLYRCLAPHVALIAISHDQARRAGDVPVAAVIHHGLDLDAFPPGDGGGDDAGDYLAFVGRMAPEKGVRSAILAAREAGARLLIAAKMREPQEERFFADQVAPLLDDRICYVGEVDHREKVRLLAGARALLNPIRWPEPFGLVMAESLACGTPVLTFREGSAPELVDHGVTGFVCEEVRDLAGSIGLVDRLSRDDCRAAAVRRFSTERMVADHLRLFARMTVGRDQRLRDVVGGEELLAAARIDPGRWRAPAPRDGADNARLTQITT